MDDDTEDVVEEVRDIIMPKRLGEEVDDEYADNLPSPVNPEEIIEEHRYDEFCQSVMAKGTAGKESVLYLLQVSNIFYLLHWFNNSVISWSRGGRCVPSSECVPPKRIAKVAFLSPDSITFTVTM